MGRRASKVWPIGRSSRLKIGLSMGYERMVGKFGKWKEDMDRRDISKDLNQRGIDGQIPQIDGAGNQSKIAVASRGGSDNLDLRHGNEEPEIWIDGVARIKTQIRRVRKLATR